MLSLRGGRAAGPREAGVFPETRGLSSPARAVEPAGCSRGALPGELRCCRGCVSGVSFRRFALVQVPRPAPPAFGLHLPALGRRGRHRRAPADLSPALRGLETWQGLWGGRCLGLAGFRPLPPWLGQHTGPARQWEGSSLFSRRFPGQRLTPLHGAFVLCSLLAPGTSCRQRCRGTCIPNGQSLYPREFLSFKVVFRDTMYISVKWHIWAFQAS